jgi:hypothetical protein
MGIETAIIAGGLALGAAAAASNRPKAPTQSSTQTSEPWAPQGDNLQVNYQLAEQQRAALYGKPWQGDLSVDMPQATRDALAQSAGYAQGQGGVLANQAGNTAGALLGASSPFLQNAQAAAGQPSINETSQGVLTAAASGQPMAQTGAVGQAGQAGAQGAMQNAAGLVQQAAGPNPAQAALGMGGQFANDPVVQQQIDNAALDVTRNFNEVTAPGLNARASAGGNLNSARAGIAEAVARRDAGESVGRIAATMRGNAFNQGVGAAMEGNAQNNTLALGANQQMGAIGTNLTGVGEQARQFDAGMRTDAAARLGALDLQGRDLALQANEQLGEATFRGFDAAQSAGALFDANTGRQINASETLRAEQERANQEALADYRRNYDWNMSLIADNMGVVTDGGSWGGTTMGTMVGPTPAGGNILQGALGGAMMGAGVSPYFRSAPTVGGTPKNF